MIANPYVILALLVAWLASTAGVGYWQRHDGAAQVMVACQRTQAAESARATVAIQAAQTAARAREQQYAAGLATISTTYQEALTHAQTQHTADLAAIRSGALRLRVQYPAAAAVRPGDGSASTTAATAGGRDGSQGSDLPGSVAVDLLALADDADNIARQLAACQAVIVQDRAQ